MENLSREQREAVFDESVDTDLDEVPSEFLAELSADAERLIASRESQHTD